MNVAKEGLDKEAAANGYFVNAVRGAVCQRHTFRTGNNRAYANALPLGVYLL